MSEQRPENQNYSDSHGPQSVNRWESRREWSNNDPLRGLLPGMILVLVGLLAFLATRGILEGDSWVQYLLIGLGSIFLLDAFLRYFNPVTHYRVYGKFIAGSILILVGVAIAGGINDWWPLGLIAGGAVILLRMLFRRQAR
jgi:hypothetical protein